MPATVGVLGSIPAHSQGMGLHNGNNQGLPPRWVLIPSEGWNRQRQIFVIKVECSIEPKDLEKVGCLSKKRTTPPQIIKDLSKYTKSSKNIVPP